MSTYIEDALYQELVATAAVANLIGGTGTSARLFEGEVPQNTAQEYIWFQRETNPKTHTLTQQSSMDEAHLVFTIVASTRAKRKALADALSTALRAMTKSTVQSVWVDGVLQTDERDDAIPEDDGSQTKRYVTEQDYTVFSAR